MKGINVFTERRPLEPYGTKNSCPKCGCQFIESKYNQLEDVMVRKCPCGYIWHEAPLDRKAQS